MGSIVGLAERVAGLSASERKLFEGIFDVSVFEGELAIPESFEEKAWAYFSEKDGEGRPKESMEEVLGKLKRQRIVRTFNKWTGEGALFNELRASRPGQRGEEAASERERVREHIERARGNCDFCEAERYTSADTFGRIRGKHCVTGANVAKFDALHGLIFFERHNPLEFSLEEVSDYIETGFRWFASAGLENEGFEYPFFMWNCLGRSGASQVHGHAQVLLGRGGYYGRIEVLRRSAEAYGRESGRDYFEDLYKAHAAVGLGSGGGEVKFFANVTPAKEKELVVISGRSPAESGEAKEAIYRVLRGLIDVLGVTCFNLAISMPRIGSEEIPYVVRVVDRGGLFKATSDIAGMELYGSVVVASDPYSVIGALGAG